MAELSYYIGLYIVDTGFGSFYNITGHCTDYMYCNLFDVAHICMSPCAQSSMPHPSTWWGTTVDRASSSSQEQLLLSRTPGESILPHGPITVSGSLGRRMKPVNSALFLGGEDRMELLSTFLSFETTFCLSYKMHCLSSLGLSSTSARLAPQVGIGPVEQSLYLPKLVRAAPLCTGCRTSPAVVLPPAYASLAQVVMCFAPYLRNLITKYHSVQHPIQTPLLALPPSPPHCNL